MEFICRISKKDYRDALRLKRKNLRRIVFAVLALDAVLWMWWMVLAIRGDISLASTVFGQAIAVLLWPGLMLVFFRWAAWYGYRKNQNIQSEFTYRLNEEGISYKSCSGGSGETRWSSLSYWRESKTVFILVFPSNIFLIYPWLCMTDGQQEEFRALVTRALPKK
jgi:hypothetical protein